MISMGLHNVESTCGDHDLSCGVSPLGTHFVQYEDQPPVEVVESLAERVIHVGV